MSKSQKPSTPLTEQDIMGALKHSGYPLEIRLLQAFEEAGFDPSIGTRFKPDMDAPSVEVDLIARCGAALAKSHGHVYLTAMVEAKQLGERVAYVGFKWKQPDRHSMRSMRIRFSGIPTCKVLPKISDNSLIQLMLGDDEPLAAALDPLNEPTVCRHWCYVRQSAKNKDEAGNPQIEAKKEDEARLSFEKLVRVTTWLEQDHASHLVRHSGNPPLLRIQLLLPTIILSTPTLYLYDALSNELVPTDRLILEEMYEAAGTTHARYVDVLTDRALPAFIERYKQVVGALQSACNGRLDYLRSSTVRHH